MPKKIWIKQYKFDDYSLKGMRGSFLDMAIAIDKEAKYIAIRWLGDGPIDIYDLQDNCNISNPIAQLDWVKEAVFFTLR